MKTSFLIVLLVVSLFLFPLIALADPPFVNTITEEFNTIDAADPTTFVNSVYKGRGERYILDRRLEEETKVNVYLFRANYADGPSIEFQVNPEFGSREVASAQVDVYAPIIGRLPFVLRVGLEVIWMNAGEGWFAIGTGGILIHTDTAQSYLGSLIEEILAHEASHVSLDSVYNTSIAWAQAQEADGAAISTYALNSPWEDPTESFLAWLAYRFKDDRISASTAQKIIDTIPHRIAFYDGLYLNMRPIDDSEFPINPGLNGAWFNSATTGQGFLLEVLPDTKQMFLAWFTFDVERPALGNTAILGKPGQRWLTAFGPYEGGTANLTIYLTEGGVFDQGQPPATTDQSGYGTMTVEFADCTAGLVSYEIPSLGLQGQIPIERIALDNVTLCGTLAVPLD